MKTVINTIRIKATLNRMAFAADSHRRNRQDRSRKERHTCISDMIFFLRQNLKQSNEWTLTLYANFIDFNKAFASI